VPERGTTVGLIGCGSWGRHILRDLVSLGCRVPVVARSPDSVTAARQGGAADVAGSIGALPEVAGVVVATPTSTHAEVLEEALAFGVPVFVEKPLTDDPVSAHRLAAAAPERLFVMDKWRYHPGIELLRDLARSGDLGAPLGVATTRVGWGNPHSDTDSIWVLAPHDLAIGREILGRLPEPVSAVVDVPRGYPTGLTAVLGPSPWLTLAISTRSPARRREIRLLCESGIAQLEDGYSDAVNVYRQADPFDSSLPPAERHPISTELPLLRELRSFVEHLEGGPPPKSSAEDGALVVETIASLRSLAGLSR
jgi:predicted dehydrogenase